MPSTVEQLTACMSWAAENGLTEVVLTIGSSQVTIRRDKATDSKPVPLPMVSSDPVREANGDSIEAPLAGVCHLAPEPGGQRFIAAGYQVAAGQTLCIIEAMKMMTPVTASKPGLVEAVLVEDGATVDAGTSLMRIV